MSSISAYKYMAFANRGLNAVINTRFCVVLKTRPGKLSQADFLWISLSCSRYARSS